MISPIPSSASNTELPLFQPETIKDGVGKGQSEVRLLSRPTLFKLARTDLLPRTTILRRREFDRPRNLLHSIYAASHKHPLPLGPPSCMISGPAHRSTGPRSPSRPISDEEAGQQQGRPSIHSKDFALVASGRLSPQRSVRSRSNMSQTPTPRRHRRSETPLSPRLNQPGAAAAATASIHPYQTHARHRSELSPRRSRSPERYGPGPSRLRDGGRHRSSFSLSSTTPTAATANLPPLPPTSGSALWPAPAAMSSIREFPHSHPPPTSGATYGQGAYHASHPPSGTPSVMNPVYNPQHQPLPSFSTAMGWTSQAATYAGPAPVANADPQRSKDFSADFTESSEGSIVTGRDLGRERAPRSMMACKLRCRKRIDQYLDHLSTQASAAGNKR